MVKIGILSMHRVVNNGSYLQAYGLKSSLELLGAKDISFVDFHNTITEEKDRNKDLVRMFKHLKHMIQPKYWSYEKTLTLGNKFRKKMVDEFQPILFSAESNYPENMEEYDLLIFGSDEIFNICQFSDRGKQIPWELMGEDVKGKRLVSYAAAFGQTDLDAINKVGEIEHCKRLLGRFSALSARDENAMNLLEKLGNCAPRLHIDPVLLLQEFPADEEYRRLPYRYLIVYAYSRRIDNPEEINAICEYAKQNDLKIVCVNCFQTWCDVSIVASPFALLQYIGDSECVVTDTFHGTVFSIRNNKRFATIVRDSNRNKLRSLLKQFNIEDREVSDISKLGAILESPIDYDMVNTQLKKERKKAMDYLAEQIKMAETR